jgi:hypothetical protein
MPPGSTLILGAVIVTVMSWECSLSPSSVIEGGEVSQLMLAGRANRLSADHPVPLVRGGPLRPEQYRVLCVRCQGRQGAELAREVGGDR